MAAALLDTPSRLLKRVQQLEDMELPSLPSFQHDDIDYDSMSGTESSRDDFHQATPVLDESTDDLATPHPLRKATGPPPSSTISAATRSSADSFSTASGSPFPPLASSSRQGTPSPYEPATAFTSTPYSMKSRSLSRSLAASTNDMTTTTSRTSRHERTQSGTGSLGNSTYARRERWQTPGEMSGSFSGEEIAEEMDLGTEKSVPLNDQSEMYDHSQSLPELPSLIAQPEETPITRRLSSGHVLFERPRRRGPSAANFMSATLEESSSGPSTPATSVAPVTPAGAAVRTPPSAATVIHVPQQQDRIPSLSRSEVSGTDTSGAATTPEGPTRNVSMMTPRSEAHHEYELTGEYQYESGSDAEQNRTGNPTLDYQQEYEYESRQDGDTSNFEQDMASPAKTYNSMSLPKHITASYAAQLSTPGMARTRHMSEDAYTPDMPTPVQNVTALNDITQLQQNTPSIPYTPSPAGMMSKISDPSTPRAPLDDAQRRKSHVLAVLSSSGLPSRIARPSVRGTPHPLRRVSTAPASESIAEEGSSIASDQQLSLMTPSMHSRLTIDQSGNESFVSIASSADLTSDRRASHLNSRLSRGNTSFPTILLPTSAHSTSAGGSLKGLSDQRVDGIKIHKHLNAMNKQLLETNADLAREAEAWRDEVDRLRGALHEAGIEVEEIDVLANIHADRSVNADDLFNRDTPGAKSDRGISQLLGQVQRGSSPGSNAHNSALDLLQGMSPEEHAAVMQEMAERLESLEEDVTEKDQLIADLQDQLHTSKGSTTPDDQQLHMKIEDLTKQVTQGEQMRVDLHNEFAQKTEQHAKRFGDICSSFEDQVRTLEKEVGHAKEDIDRLQQDKARLEKLALSESSGERETELRKQLQAVEGNLRRAEEETKGRAEEVERFTHQVTQLESDSADLKFKSDNAHDLVADLEEKLKTADMRNEHATADIEAMKGELRAACEAQKETEDEAGRLEEDMAALRQANADQEAELDRQHEQIEDLHRAMADLQSDLASARDEAPIDQAAAKNLLLVEEELQAVSDALALKEAEVEALRGKLDVADLAANALRASARRSTSSTSPVATAAKASGLSDMSAREQESFVTAVEERLDEAYREIGRLKHELGTAPHMKSTLEIKDARIQALEREKAALADRLASNKSISSTSMQAPANGMQYADSPFKQISPFVHKAIASLKTPKTPGPMKELSWLQTTIGDSNEPILEAQLEYLKTELDNANNQLDHNFSRLEAAGYGALELAEKLAAAQERISELEDEMRTLVQRNKASLALVSAQREDRERNNEGRMSKALAAVHQQMEDLKYDVAAERSRLQQDNGRLNDLVSELRLKSRAEIESFRAELERLSADSEEDLRAAQDELSRAIRERDEMQNKLRSSKDEVHQLERDLSDEKRAYESLNRRNGANARDGTAQAAMQNELAQKSETVRALEAALREAVDSADKLRNVLKERSQALDNAETELSRYRSEREGIARELADFERDLCVQRTESEEFGRQLQLLRREQDAGNGKHAKELIRLERELRDAKERSQAASRQLKDSQVKQAEFERWRDAHRCASSASPDMLADQKARFKTQSRELASQIRYLKAKYTRESTFRNALALQKRYLLLLVGGMSLNEQATLREIAKMGFPTPEPPRPRRTLKAVALAVLSIVRAKNTARQWRVEVEMKSRVVGAHDERRRVSART